MTTNETNESDAVTTTTWARRTAMPVIVVEAPRVLDAEGRRLHAAAMGTHRADTPAGAAAMLDAAWERYERHLREHAPARTRRVRRHEGVVTLPGHGFAAHRLQRMTLTGRHMSPVRPGPVVAARMAWATREPARVEVPVVRESEECSWQEERVVERTLDMRWALASLAIVVAVVWCALRAAGISVL